MIETTIQKVGNSPTSVAPSASSIGRSLGYLLADRDGTYIVSGNGVYTDLGLITGMTPDLNYFTLGNIPISPVVPGTMV